jgi:hypothetical protein
MEHSNYNLEKVFKELDAHCRVNGRYGFTIPYLIKLSADNEEALSINGFLFVLSNNPQKCFVTRCGDLDEMIIGLHKPSEYAPIHMYPHFGSLYYDDDKIGKFADFQTFTDHLTELYLPRITQGTFSKNPDTLKWE